MKKLLKFLLNILGIFFLFGGFGNFLMAFMTESFFGYIAGTGIILLGILILPNVYIKIQKYFTKHINTKIFALFYILFLIMLYVISSIIIPLNTSYGDDIISLGEEYKQIR